MPPPKDVTCISLQTNSRTCKSAAPYILPRQINPDFTMKPQRTDQDYPQTPNGESKSAMSKKPTTEEPKRNGADEVGSSNRLIGAGMELAGFAIIPAILGLVIDRWTQTNMPYFTAAGTLMDLLAVWYSSFAKYKPISKSFIQYGRLEDSSRWTCGAPAFSD